jgi:GAF domain-containing protein
VDIALEEDRSVHQVFGDQQAVPDLAATVLRTGAAQLVSDLGDLPREAGAPDGHARERLCALGIRSYIVVPLRAGGRTLGALTFLAAKPRGSFGPEDLAVANNLACRCGLAIDNARLQQEVQRLARLDGVLLAARTMAHELNNQLTLTVSSAELLASDPALPSHLSELASEAQEGAHAAARTVGRLQRVAHLEEIDSGAGVGTILDLGRSTA